MVSHCIWLKMFYLPSPDWRWEPVLGKNHQTSAGRNHQTSTWLRIFKNVKQWKGLRWWEVEHSPREGPFKWSPPFRNVLPPTTFGLSTVYTTYKKMSWCFIAFTLMVQYPTPSNSFSVSSFFCSSVHLPESPLGPKGPTALHRSQKEAPVGGLNFLVYNICHRLLWCTLIWRYHYIKLFDSSDSI